MLCQVMDCTAFQATRDAHNKKLPVVNQTPALSTLFSQAVEQTYGRSVKSWQNCSLATAPSMTVFYLTRQIFILKIRSSILQPSNVWRQEAAILISSCVCCVSFFIQQFAQICYVIYWAQLNVIFFFLLNWSQIKCACCCLHISVLKMCHPPAFFGDSNTAIRIFLLGARRYCRINREEVIHM